MAFASTYLQKFKSSQQKYEPILQLISEYNSAIDHVSTLQTELNNLEREKSLAEAELAAAKLTPAISPEQAEFNKQSQTVLERRILQLQEDLLNVHKNKENNASEVLRLTELLKKTDHELQITKSILEKANANILVQEKEILSLKRLVSIKSKSVDDMKDEFEILRMASDRIDEKYNHLTVEHESAIAQIISMRTEQAKNMDKEHEIFKKYKLMEAENKKLVEMMKSGPSKLLPDFESVNLADINMNEIGGVGGVPSKKSADYDMSCDIHALAVQKDIYACAGTDTTVQLYKNGHRSYTNFTDSNGTVNSLEFTSDGAHLIDACNDYACHLWKVGTKRRVTTLTGHQGKVMATRFFNYSDGFKVVSGSHDRTLRVWDLSTSRCTKTLLAGSACSDIGIMSSNVIVSGHFDKSVRLYDSRTGKEIGKEKLDGRVCSIQVAGERNDIYATSNCNRIYKLDSRNLNQVVDIYGDEGMAISSDLSRSVLSPDGTKIAQGSSNRMVYVFDTENGNKVGELKCDDIPVSLAWDESGRIFVGQKGKKLTVFV